MSIDEDGSCAAELAIVFKDMFDVSFQQTALQVQIKTAKGGAIMFENLFTNLANEPLAG